MSSVALEGLRKKYGSVEVLHGIDLSIDHGEFVVFVGPSGCGKSTLLRMIAGLEAITAGRLLIGDKLSNNIQPSKRDVAMVFQNYALYPHMTVRGNMSFGMRLARRPKPEIEERVLRAARILRMENLLERRPAELSGGQRQRVAIGRAIVRSPGVFLFDEPLSNLDANLRGAMRIELANLHHELETTMIYVTHDQVEAMTLADRIVVMNEGIVEQFGTPLELYHQPANLFVAQFIGSPGMNCIETEVESVTAEGAVVALPGGGNILVPVETGDLKSGDKVTLGVRPEGLNEHGEGDATIPATVAVVERLGSETYLYVEAGGMLVTVEASGITETQYGKQIAVGVDAAECHLFDANGNAFRRHSAPSVVTMVHTKSGERRRSSARAGDVG